MHVQCALDAWRCHHDIRRIARPDIYRDDAILGNGCHLTRMNDAQMLMLVNAAGKYRTGRHKDFAQIHAGSEEVTMGKLSFRHAAGLYLGAHGGFELENGLT